MDRGALLVALGIDADASYEEAQAAYRRLAALTHPDLGGDPVAFAAAATAWRALAPMLPRRPRTPVVAPPVLAPVEPGAAPAPSRPAAVAPTPDPLRRRACASYAATASMPDGALPLTARRRRPAPRPTPAGPFADLLAALLAA
jgi:hypothetical protein